MPCSVRHIGDQREGVAFRIAQESIYRRDKHLDQVDILPLVEASDIVGLGSASLMEDQVDSTCVVDDIEPVTHILALSIDGQRLTMTQPP